jgi:hypothetical protein
MEKISIFILLLLLLTINAISQSIDGVVVSQLTTEQSSAMTEIGKLNIQVIDLFKEKKLDDALRVALNIQSIIEKKCLDGKSEYG